MTDNENTDNSVNTGYVLAFSLLGTLISLPVFWILSRRWEQVR
jgi:hypothetical protein